MPAHHVRQGGASHNKENVRGGGGGSGAGLKKNGSAAKVGGSFGKPQGSHPQATNFELGDRVSVRMDKVSVCPGEVNVVY